VPLPNGVTTFTLTGDELDATGAAGIPGTRGTLVPVDASGNPVRIVHLATGVEIVPAGVNFTIAADGTWTVGPLPYTDQAGLSVVGFQYKVTWNVPPWRASPGDKTFSVPSGTTSPVLYSTVTASPTVPTVLVPATPSVASVGGNTGVVTADQLATSLNATGNRLSDTSLKATYERKRFVDVRDFGAKIDATTDDTAAIQAAINSLGTTGTSIRGQGGTVYIPTGTARTSATLVIPSNVHLRGAGMAASVIQLLPGSNCDIVRFYKSTGSGNSNAFWSSIQDIMLDGRCLPGNIQQGTAVTDITLGAAGTTTISSAAQHTFAVGEVIQGIGVMPGTTISAVGTPATSATLSQPLLNTVNQAGTAGAQSVMVGGDPAGRPWAGIYHETNPYNTIQSGDNQFDPTHLIRNVWIYAPGGDGIRVKGRADILIDRVKVSFAQGSGFVVDFDVTISNSLVERPVGHGLWLSGHSSNRVVGCKFYNTYAYGAFLQGGGSGVGEVTLAGVDIQQANSHGLYLQNYAAPVICQGVTVAQAGFNNTTSSVASGQDIAAVVLDATTGAIVDAAATNGPVGLKVINSSAMNDVRITRVSSVAGATDLSANNQSPLGATNRVVINGAVVNPVPSLAALTGDVALAALSDTQILQYDAASGKWKNVANTGGGGATSYNNVFGDGSDGAVTLDGTVTVSGITKAGSVYTLSRDFYFSALTINSGVTLNTKAYRLFCTGTVNNAGTIACNGAAGGADGTAGAAINSSGMLATAAGGAGNTGGGSNPPSVGSRLGVGNSGAGGQAAPARPVARVGRTAPAPGCSAHPMWR
jgi:hypothetical protein